MLQAYFKGGKLPTGKPSTSGSQKSSKEKKQREKPVPWVEKVRIKFKIFFSLLTNENLSVSSFSTVQSALMMLWNSRKFVLSFVNVLKVLICRTCCFMVHQVRNFVFSSPFTPQFERFSTLKSYKLSLQT
jgi:hypothetical protein